MLEREDHDALLQIVGASGLRKDNAHLDLRQLFIGSCGAFGIITSAILEVQPRPRQSAVALLVPRDEDGVCVPQLWGRASLSRARPWPAPPHRQA
jgi:FAD/FMN-containing dehydrogenase